MSSVNFTPAPARVAVARTSVFATRPRAMPGVAFRTSKLPVSACMKERIAATEFWRAQQVNYTQRLGSQTVTEPAIIMGAASSQGLSSPAIRVKLVKSGYEVVASSAADLAPLNESFSPGDTVKRAMLNGAEEDAVVVSTGAHDAVTIRILPAGPTYSSDIMRLRKVSGSVVAQEAGSSVPITHALDVAALERALAAKFPALSGRARPNPHAAPGTSLHSRFAAAAAAAAHKKVDIMVHGTGEANIGSIMQTSLRGRPGCGTCWFTDELSTASTYMRGAKRVIAFAVLRDRDHTAPIYTTNDPAHHLPVFELPIC